MAHTNAKLIFILFVLLMFVFLPFNASATCVWNSTTVNSSFGLLGYGSDFNFSDELGVYWERPHPGPFQWEVIEEVHGVYNFTWSDWYVNNTQFYGINILATIFPYAMWDQDICHQNDDYCNGSGFMPRELARGADDGNDTEEPPIHTIPVKRCKPCNMTAYRNFVKAMVERYDGDGVSDMPDLCTPIYYYETLNEPSMNGSDLSFFRGNASEYVDVLNNTYSAVKEACPSCKVLVGGVAGYSTDPITYFNETIDYGGGEYFDIANIHAISTDESVNVQFKQLLDARNLDKDIWLTEVSFYSLDPDGRPYRSLQEQAQVFSRAYAIGMANGTYKKLFYTMRTGEGGNNSTLQTEALAYDNGTKKPIYYAHQTFVDLLSYYDSAAQEVEGRYKFTTGSTNIYVLWNTSGPILPEVIAGPLVNVTYINGTSSIVDKNNVTLDMEPIFVIEEQESFNLTGDYNPEGVRIWNGSVPYIYSFGNGTYRLYYCGSSGGLFGSTSTDGLNFTGEDNTGIAGCDPSLIRISNGSYRMYFKKQNQQNSSIHTIHSAISGNAISFTEEGLRFEYNLSPDNGFTSVPDAVQYPNGSVRVYYCNGDSVASAFSPNGINFTRDTGLRMQYALDPNVMLLSNGTYRMYYVTSQNESPSGQGIISVDTIRSALSTDGINFAKESGIRFARGNSSYDSAGVMDPSAIILSDGRIRIYYGGTDAVGATRTMSAISNLTQTTVSIPLFSGWNLFGVSVNVSSYNASRTLSLCGCGRVARYANSGDGSAVWEEYYTTPVSGGTDFNLSLGSGYFVKCDSNSSLNLSGSTVSGLNSTVYYDWNILAWTNTSGSSNASRVLNNIPNAYRIARYANNGASALWEEYYSSPVSGGTDFTVNYTGGYFIKTSQNSSWVR